MFLNRAIESNAILTVDAEVESQPVRFLRFVADADMMISSTEIGCPLKGFSRPSTI